VTSTLRRLALLTLIYAAFIGMSNADPLWHQVARSAGYVAFAVLLGLMLIGRRYRRSS
jgi:hypothetical protein